MMCDLLELVLVIENRVMSGAAGTQKTSVTLQIKVEFGRMGNIPVDDSPSRAITRAVAFTLV